MSEIGARGGRFVLAAVLAVLALPVVAIGLMALEKVTRSHLDGDRFQFVVIAVLLLAAGSCLLGGACLLVRRAVRSSVR